MSVLQDSYEIISYMLINKKTFNKSLNAFFTTNVRNDDELKKFIKVYILFFKKYYYFEALTKELLTKATPSLITYIGITLINVRLLNVDIDEAIEFIKNALKKNKEKYSDEIEKAIIDFKNKKEYPLNNIKKGSVESLSVFFNLPLWFIKMTLAQHGLEKSKLIFESFKNKKYVQYFLKSKLVDLDSIDEELNKKFTLDTKTNLYLTSESDNELIKNKTYVKTSSFYEEIFKNDLKLINKYITLYQNEDSNFFYRFLNQYLYLNNVINFAVDSFYNVKDAITVVAQKRINDLFVYESTPNELISHLSFKQDAIFYAAKSTYFEEFYFKPEYRVLFDTELIDKFIKEQKSSLKEISSYVENGGRLIYLVETIDTKETSKVISAFLSENNDFILEKEEFIIPNEENSSFGYYAILKRENHA